MKILKPLMMNIKITLCLVFASLISVNGYSQCAAPTITSAEYCPGQKANILIDDTDTDVKYQWYTDMTSVVGSYGLDGNGRHFQSSGNQSGIETFYYEKEVSETIGAPVTINSGGTTIPNDGVNNYGQNLSNTQDFAINSITVIAEMPDPTENYGFNVRSIQDAGTAAADTSFSNWISGTPATFTSLGGDFYRVVIPVVDIRVEAGAANRVEVISSDEAGGAYSAVPSFYWWGAAQYSGGTHASGSITLDDPTISIAGTDRTPLLMNMDVTVLCPRTPVTTSLAAQCCIPVGNNVTITSPIPNPINADFPFDLTAGGADVTGAMHYFWYKDGVLQNSGLGLTDFEVTSKGQYEVRVVNEAADIGASACYSNTSILLSIRSIFAPDDFSVCVGEPISVNAYGAEGNYQWSSTSAHAQSGIVTPNGQGTDVQITTPGVYTLTVSGDVLLDNIASDGKFEQFDDTDNFNPAQPNLTFETTYGIAGGDGGTYITNNSQFRVDDVLQAWSTNNAGLACNNDPNYFLKTDAISGTTVSRGNIFYADATSSGTGAAGSAAFAMNNFLWQLSNQPVEPGQTYTFSLDVSEWNNATAPIMMLLVNGTPLPLSINGTPVGGNTATIPTVPACSWHTVTGTWNSGANTTATITVAEVGKVSPGHEFAMDDITFSTARGTQSDDVVVTVNTDCQLFEARDDSTVCAGDEYPLYLKENTGFFIDWKDGAGNVVSTEENATAFSVTDETYIATTKFPVVGLVKDGDLENGNMDFTTGLTPIPNTTLEVGEFMIGTGNDTRLHNHMLTGFSDHTLGTTAGQMYIGRLSQNSTDIVFDKDITTTAGETYGFSVWVKHLHNLTNATNAEPYPFEIRIDGVTGVSQTINPGDDWTEIKHSWIGTGASTNVQLFSALNSPKNEFGFAIDDIRLVQLGADVTDPTTVTVDLSCITLTLTDEDCDGATRVVSHQTNGIFSGWYDDTGNLVSTDDTLKVVPAGTETYSAVASIAVQALNENGNMDQGIVGQQQLFSKAPQTDFNQPLRSPNYGYVTNANDYNGNHYANLTSASGSGQFMLANSDRNNTNQTIFLSDPLAVTAGENYALSLNLAYATKAVELAKFTDFFPIEVYVGTDLVASVDLAVNNNWQDFSYSYIPTTSGNKEISFVLTGKQQNPYIDAMQFFAIAIDEVKLAPTQQVVAASIEVAPCCTQLAPTAGVTTGTATICEGGNLVLTATPDAGTTGPITYQWYKDGVAITGETGATYTVPTTAAAIAADYTVTVTSSATCTGESPASTAVTVVVNGTPTVTASSDEADGELCLGEDIVFNGGGANTYVWDNGVTNNTAFTPAAVGNVTYTVTGTDVNTCTNTATIDIEVHALPVVTASSDEADGELCLGEDVIFNGGGANTYVWDNGVTNNVAFIPAATGNVTYTVTGTDVNTCTNTATVDIEVHALPVVTASSDDADDEICAGDNITLTGGGANTYVWDNGVTDGIAFAPAATTTYEVTGTDANTCTGTATIEIIVNDLPTADISGGGAICNDGTDTEDIVITLTGSGPWTVIYDVPAPAADVTINPTTSPVTISVMAEGDYALVSVSDAKCGTGTLTGGPVGITYHDEPTVTTNTITCDPTNPVGGAPGTYNYIIELELAGGDGAYDISGATGTLVGTTWTSNPIEESNVTNLTVQDGNMCNPFNINGLQRICSCAESVALSVTGASSICEEGTLTSSELTVTLDNGGNVVPDWAFAVTGPDGNPLPGQDYRTVRYTGPTTFTIPVTDTGAYNVVDLNGTCNGTTSPEVTIDYLPSPKGQLSGSAKVCSDISDTVDVTIDVQDVAFPATVVLSRATGGDTTITVTTATTTFRTSVANTYTFSSITDDSTCTAKAADLTGTAVIDTITPPVANIFSVDGDDDLNVNMLTFKEKLTNKDTVDVIATAITDAYLGTWKIDGYQGDTTDTRIDTVTVIGLDSIADYPTDTAYTDKGITRLVYCVTDTAGICDIVTDTLKIVKVTGSIVTDSDTTVCEDYASFTKEGVAPLSFETSQWQYGDNQIMPAGTVVPGGRILTIPASLAPGSYVFNYIIVNTVDPMAPPVVAIYTVNIDQLPTFSTVRPLPLIEVCVEDGMLNAETPLVGGGIWEKISGTGNILAGEETTPNATVENLVDGQSGIYRWRLSNGVCVNRDSVDATISRVGDLTNASISVNGITIPDGDTLPFCINETPAIFNGGFDAATEGGVWDVVQGSATIIDESIVAVTQNMALASGLSEIKWLVNNTAGLCPSDSVSIFVNVTDLPVANIVNVTPTELCEGEAVTVTVDPVGIQTTTVEWSVGGTPLVATAGGSTEEFILQAGLTDVFGNKTITWTASNIACGSINDNASITVNEVFDPQFDIDLESTKCENGTVTYSLINTQDLTGAIYEWSYAGTGTQGATNGSTFTISDLGITTGSTVSLTVGSGVSCNAGDSAQTKTVDLEVIGAPTPALDMTSLDTAICETETLTIFANNLEGGSLQWFYEGIAIPGETAASITNRNLPGIYHLEETSTVCGAVKTMDLTLTLDEMPNVFAGNDRVILEEDVANLEGSIFIGDTTWSTSSTVISNSNIIVDHNDAQSPLNTSGTGGIYTLYLIATNGQCTNFDDVVINIRTKIKAPNVFTPNGDGENDFFVVSGLETYPIAKMYICNRWGNSVFESKTDHYNDELWKGNVPEGVYYYTIDIGDGKGTGHSGVIHVFRD